MQQLISIVVPALSLIFFCSFSQEIFAAGTAAQYVPLAGLPQSVTSANNSLPSYLNALYMITLGVGLLIGVLKIALAGTTYAMSEVVTSKEQAIKDIRGVLIGVAILLLPYIVLTTIYPGLVKFNIFQTAGELLPSSQTSSGPPPDAPVQQTCVDDGLGGCLSGQFVPAVFNPDQRPAVPASMISSLDGRNQISTFRANCEGPQVRGRFEMISKIVDGQPGYELVCNR